MFLQKIEASPVALLVRAKQHKKILDLPAEDEAEAWLGAYIVMKLISLNTWGGRAGKEKILEFE